MSTPMRPTEIVAHMNAVFREAEKNDGEIWAMAKPRPDLRASIQYALTVTDGQNKYHVPPIAVGDPVYLTTRAPIDVLKRCADLRTAVTRGALVIMSGQEADAYFTRRSQLLGKPAEQLRDEAVARAEAQAAEGERNINAPPITRLPQRDGPENKLPDTNAPIRVEETISSMVRQLMVECDPSLKTEEQRPAPEILGVLDAQRETITLEEWDFIRAQCPHTTVKKYCAARIAELTAGDAAGAEAETPPPAAFSTVVA